MLSSFVGTGLTQLKYGTSELRCAVSVNYTAAFEDSA